VPPVSLEGGFVFFAQSQTDLVEAGAKIQRRELAGGSKFIQ